MMDEDDQHREVYAWAGLALYEAQVFEQGVTNLLFAARLTDRSIVDDFATADEFYDKQESRPLGPVLRALRRHLSLDPSVDMRCGEAHRLRNFIVHRFFAERIELFATRDGRQLLIAELHDAVLAFRAADGALLALFLALGNAFGLTDELLQKEMADIWREAGGS